MRMFTADTHGHFVLIVAKEKQLNIKYDLQRADQAQPWMLTHTEINTLDGKFYNFIVVHHTSSAHPLICCTLQK